MSFMRIFSNFIIYSKSLFVLYSEIVKILFEFILRGTIMV